MSSEHPLSEQMKVSYLREALEQSKREYNSNHPLASTLKLLVHGSLTPEEDANPEYLEILAQELEKSGFIDTPPTNPKL
jgi:hypothetical protein